MRGMSDVLTVPLTTYYVLTVPLTTYYTYYTVQLQA